MRFGRGPQGNTTSTSDAEFRLLVDSPIRPPAYGLWPTSKSAILEIVCLIGDSVLLEDNSTASKDSLLLCSLEIFLIDPEV